MPKSTIIIVIDDFFFYSFFAIVNFFAIKIQFHQKYLANSCNS